MRNRQLIFTAAVGLVAILVAGCASAPAATPTEAPRATSVPTDIPEVVAEPTVDYANELENFDPSNFDDPTNIDNPWLPLKPGTQFIYEGVTEEGGETTEHRVRITITDLTKEIDGVTTVVSWDEDYSSGVLVETELAFYAQDNDGNVWRVGEYPEVYENNKLVDAPAWISGVKGAQAGIMMAADPQLGGRSYSQGWGPAVGFTDRWQVDEVDQETCVSVDCYDGVIVTAEYSQTEPDAFQLKFYAADVGNVRVDWKGFDATREELELVEIANLNPSEMDDARERALELEARAYEISKEVYDQTPPSVVGAEATTAEVSISEPMMESEEPVKVFEDFDPNAFTNPTVIDNGWLPMLPGSQWVYEGFTVEDDEEVPHRIEFTVTNLTKEIDGIETVVVYVVDISDDQLVEAEIAFYAQDDESNVWYFGEYPEEYEDGELVDAPAWLHGREDAKAGIKMMANQQLGTPPYFQGWGPAVEWTDYAKVVEIVPEICVTVDCYDGVLLIAESSLEEEDAYQLKFYAFNVGNVRVGWMGADATQEELELVEFVQLGPDALADIRGLALNTAGGAKTARCGLFIVN
jgi:uncharacterized protein YbaA (DUF1428 family)